MKILSQVIEKFEQDSRRLVFLFDEKFVI